MKRLFIILSAVVILAACKNETTKQLCMDLSHIQAFVPADDVNYYADSINGYATFSAENNIMIIPEEITKEQYEDLLRDKYVFRSNEIESGTALYAELDKKAGKNVDRYDSIRCLFCFDGDDNVIRSNYYIYHYPEIKQYECCIIAPLTMESFIMTEDGIIDSTFMQAETSTYDKNGIFVGQEGHDCDFHGDLWFYWYDEKNCHMVPICHYVDYRWNEETYDFDLCWISDDELLVSAVSTGNSGGFGWAGGYKATGLAPWQTPVYYKLKLSIK